MNPLEPLPDLPTGPMRSSKPNDDAKDPVVLYCTMRTDMASMNPGKAVAQGMHAATMFEEALRRGGTNDLLSGLVAKWRAETDQGFGTVLTMGVDEREMRAVDERAERFGLLHGIVHDPTYPVSDGRITHLIPIDTCGWVFGRKSACVAATYDLDLMA